MGAACANAAADEATTAWAMTASRAANAMGASGRNRRSTERMPVFLVGGRGENESIMALATPADNAVAHRGVSVERSARGLAGHPGGGVFYQRDDRRPRAMRIA